MLIYGKLKKHLELQKQILKSDLFFTENKVE